jgi:putative DNA primase/helicase
MLEFVHSAPPPQLAEKLRQILNGIKIAPPSERRAAFKRTCQRVAGEIVGKGYSRPEAADRLQDTADALGITAEFGYDAVQSDIAGGFEEPLDLNGHEFHGSISDEITSEIARLAALNIVEYERERKHAGKRLGMRADILDQLVAHARESVDDHKQGRSLKLPEPLPWPDEVDGPTLLDQMSTAIRKHVVLPENAAVAIVLWAVHTYLLDLFGITPRLSVTSPEKGCGKTTLLDAIAHLVWRPLLAASVTASSVFRVVEMHRPTLLIDEADTFLRENEELRGVLNSGHRKGGSVIRTVGEEFEPRQFSTHAACAIALIGELPATLADRSIAIELTRRRPDERIEAFRFDRTAHLDEIASKTARWASDNREKIGEIDPEIPYGVFNRAADNWRPLLAIADVVGGDWPARARSAVQHAAQLHEDQSRGVLLLTDIRAIFAERGVDRMPSGLLVNALAAVEGRPWAEWKKGKPITQNGLAALLKPFKVRPATVRVGDDTPKGYQLAHFEDAFSRYLPAGAL